VWFQVFYGGARRTPEPTQKSKDVGASSFEYWTEEDMFVCRDQRSVTGCHSEYVLLDIRSLAGLKYTT